MNLVALKPSAQFRLVCRIKPFDTPRLRDRIRHINSEKNSGQLEKSLASSLHTSIAVLSTPSLQAAIKIRAKIRFGQNSASNIHIILGKRSGFLVSNVRNQLAFVDFTLHCTYVCHYLELIAI